MQEKQQKMKQKYTNKVNMMKKEYDFSKGQRGKFYNKSVTFHVPVYLEPEIESYFTKLAKQQNTNLNDMINNLLFKDKELIELSGTKV